jgi:hypothetical protein
MAVDRKTIIANLRRIADLAEAAGDTRLYQASKKDCDTCEWELKQRCCPNAPARKVPRLC